MPSPLCAVLNNFESDLLSLTFSWQSEKKIFTNKLTEKENIKHGNLEYDDEVIQCIIPYFILAN